LFQDPDTFFDELNIGALLDNELREENKRGRDADFIVTHQRNFPQARFVGGQYKRAADGTIRLRAKLVGRGATPQSLLTEEGKEVFIATDPEDLAYDLKEALLRVLGVE
ncbi:MAG: hypothetical protein AAFZ52_15735, partial [Bacteroidota bacterium]